MARLQNIKVAVGKSDRALVPEIRNGDCISGVRHLSGDVSPGYSIGGKVSTPAVAEEKTVVTRGKKNDRRRGLSDCDCVPGDAIARCPHATTSIRSDEYSVGEKQVRWNGGKALARRPRDSVWRGENLTSDVIERYRGLYERNEYAVAKSNAQKLAGLSGPSCAVGRSKKAFDADRHKLVCAENHSFQLFADA